MNPFSYADGGGDDLIDKNNNKRVPADREQYLQTIIETTADGFWVVDTAGHIVEVNEAYCRMSGYTRNEIIGLRIRDLEAEETSEDTANRIQRIVSNGFELFRTRHRRKDGSLFPIEMSVTWVDFNGGRLVCFGRDLTERNRAEAVLEEERRRLENILEGTNVGTWEWNAQTGEVVFNERWAQMVGYTLEELSPISIETWERLVHPEDSKISRDRLSRHFAGELDHYECEARMRHKAGHWVWVLDRGKVSVRTDDGQPLLMQGTHQDITERKRAEEALRVSEERFRLLSDVTMEGIIIHKNGLAKDVNASLAKLLGYQREDLLGKNFLEFAVHPDDRKIVLENIVKNYARPYVVRGVKQNGELFFAELEARDFHFEGDVLRVAAVRDVTERVKMHEALRQSEDRYRDLFENVSDFLYFHDLQGNFIEANLSFKQVCGLKDVCKTNVRDLIPEDVRPGFSQYLERIIKHKKDEGHLKLMTEKGRIIVVEYKNSLVCDADGHPVGVRGSARDITAKLQAEKERRQVEAQLRQVHKIEAMGIMAGAVAHHYNNLLMAVMGNLEMAIEEMPSEAKCSEKLAQAFFAARRAAKLGEKMLTYLGQTVVQRELQDLCEICRKSLPELLTELPAVTALEADLPEPGPMVYANADQLRQLLSNLLINAVEASGQKSHPVSVIVRKVSATQISAVHRWPVEFLPESDGYACLEVADRGAGIAKDTIEKIFDPFFSTKFTGRGLGLAVALGIAKAHGGCIAVKSIPERGSVFSVFLPLSENGASDQRTSERFTLP